LTVSSAPRSRSLALGALSAFALGGSDVLALLFDALALGSLD
jgi:hypothetical protein